MKALTMTRQERKRIQARLDAAAWRYEWQNRQRGVTHYKRKPERLKVNTNLVMVLAVLIMAIATAFVE
jgi:hypothetical protein